MPLWMQVKEMIAINRKHNKSLHPIWLPVPAFASCSFGAANARPVIQTGELNRYLYPSFTKLNPSRAV